MKKIYSFLLLMLMVSATAFAGNAKCLLHHNGAVTIYDSDDIEAALTASADGDTLFLSEGSFAGFTITKKITVRGSGQYTKVGGDITVNIAGSPSLTNALLEGIYCNSDLKIIADVNGMQVKQCVFSNFAVPTADISNAVFDKVYITNQLNLNKYVKSLTVNNSKIYDLSHQTYLNGSYAYGLLSNASIYFFNCNIRSASGIPYVSFLNCIFGYTSNLQYCNISFCLYAKSYGLNYDEVSTSVSNCYVNTDDNDGNSGSNALLSNTVECRHNASTLVSKGFTGNDGTAVGCMGGSTPYTLVLAGPKVTESSIQLDNETKQLSVTLKVTAK